MDETRIERPRLGFLVGGVVALVGLALLAWAWHADRYWFEVHATPNFCAETPMLAVRAAALRFAAAVLGVALVLVARRAGRWAGRRTWREVALTTARFALAGVLALVACDIILRVKGSPPRETRGLPYDPATMVHPRYGYSVLPGSHVEYHIGPKVIRYIYDENGYRVPSPDEKVDFERPAILFTGESVAAGFSLNAEETYAWMVGQDLGVQGVNVAVPGFGDDSAYMRLSDELPRFKHPLATVTLALHTTIERSTWPDRPHLVIEDDGTRRWIPAETAIGTPIPRISPLIDVVHLVDHSTEALRRTRAVFAATARDARAHGAFPMFVVTSSEGAGCLPDKSGAPTIERTLFEGLDVAHVRVYLTGDELDPALRHPTVRGQRKIADAIERTLAEHGIGAGRGDQALDGHVTEGVAR